MEKKKIYVSGKISGLSPIEFTSNFKNAKTKIHNDYDWDARVINPIDLKPFLGIKSWLCYMITDLYHLRKCTHIAMQSNWIDSKGATIEYFVSKFIFKQEIIWL